MIDRIIMNLFEGSNEFYDMCELTDNTIILCNNITTKSYISDLILHCEDGNIKKIAVFYNEDDKYKEPLIKVSDGGCNYYPVMSLTCGKQKIIVTLLPEVVMSKIKNPEDLWFCDGKQIYALTEFIGYKEIYNDLYKNILQGRLGTFTGEYYKEFED